MRRRDFLGRQREVSVSTHSSPLDADEADETDRQTQGTSNERENRDNMFMTK